MGLFDKIKNVFKKEDKSVNTYEKGLSKTRKSFVNKLADLSKEYSEINDNYFEELEELLINADIGVKTVMDFMDKLQVRVSKEHITNPNDLTEIIVDELFIIYVNEEILSNKINYNENGPTVLLFVGVNGVGKTTTIAKLASKFKKEGKKVLLVAADTFRSHLLTKRTCHRPATGPVLHHPPHREDVHISHSVCTFRRAKKGLNVSVLKVAQVCHLEVSKKQCDLSIKPK